METPTPKTASRPTPITILLVEFEFIIVGSRLVADGDVLPPSVPATHKPNSKPGFAQTYAARLAGSHVIDNERHLFALTVRAYKLVRPMFFPLLAMPMRWLNNLCSLRIRSAKV